MSFEYFKAIHMIFVVTWFAGLFYIVRLFIYHTEAHDKPETERKILTDQFKIMERRLWYGITWPSAIMTSLFGLSMIHDFFPLTDEPWLILKLIFVVGLFIYQFLCGNILKKLAKDEIKYSSNQLRIWNEVATVFLVAIVFLVILKDIINMSYGLAGLVLFCIVLMAGIKIYKKVRE